MIIRSRSNGRARIAALTAATALAVAGGLVVAGPASAADNATISGATLTWGLSNEVGGGAYAGGCNFLSAGVAGNTESSRVWTEADGFYSSHEGNVTVKKPNAEGAFVQTSWATKCQTPAGTPVSPMSTSSITGNVVEIVDGAGTRAADGSVTINWTGDFTVAFYGGMTYWTATNPVLQLDANGTGTLKASAHGFGTDQAMSGWSPIAPREITLANFTAGTLTDSTFTATPAYLGVEVNTAGTPQNRTAASWGSFPQSFVDFHNLTGQSSYWYSSGGGRDAAKPAVPVSVSFTAGAPEVPADNENDITVQVPTAPTAPSGSFGWAFDSATPVSLGTATQQGNNFVAVGTLNTITVTDTRTGGTAPYNWSISGSVKDFTSSAGTFSGSFLGWTPKVVSGGATVTAGTAVASSHSGGVGLKDSRTLASSTAAASATVGADLSLVIPGSTAAGNYTSTLTVTALQ